MVNCSSQYSSFCLYLPYHYTSTFIEYCDDNSNACAVDRCRETIRPQVVFCARSPFSKTFMPLLNNISILCCSSTNLFRWSVNDENYIATQNFDLYVCTLFALCNMSRKIFCFIFGQLWYRKVSTKQPHKLPHSLRNSSVKLHSAGQQNLTPARIFPSIRAVHYF